MSEAHRVAALKGWTPEQREARSRAMVEINRLSKEKRSKSMREVWKGAKKPLWRLIDGRWIDVYRSGKVENDLTLVFFDGKHGARDIYIPTDLMNRKPKKPDYWPSVKTPKCPCYSCNERNP